jgi:hypothetical protein
VDAVFIWARDGIVKEEEKHNRYMHAKLYIWLFWNNYTQEETFLYNQTSWFCTVLEILMQSFAVAVE